MKIVSVSLYNNWNFGTVLQNYALNKFLIESGYRAKVLNYINRYDCSAYNTKDKVRFLLGLWKLRLGFFVRIHKTKRFCKQNIVFTKKYKTKTDVIDNPPVADLYIVGSDQVWNKQFGGEFYYLNWLKNTDKISYSSSIGRTELAEDELKIMGDKLSDFKHIAVREDSAKELIARAGIQNVEHVMDPVFLLNREHYEKFTSPKQGNDYVLLLSYKRRDEEIKRVLESIQKKTDYDVIEIATGKRKYPDLNSKHYGNPGVEDTLSFIRNASFVLTTSFHTIAFCLIFNKQFAVLPACEGDSRLTSILKIAGLEGRLMTEGKCDIEELMKPIDYESVNKRIEAMTEKSKKWLIDAVEDCKKEL